MSSKYNLQPVSNRAIFVIDILTIRKHFAKGEVQMSGKKVRVVLTNLFILIALLVTVVWAINLNTPKDGELDGLVLVFYAIAGVFIYIRGVEELVEAIQTKPKSEGRLDKIFWIVSSWWKSWKAGALSKPVQIGYVIGSVLIIVLNLLVHERSLAFALSVVPAALIFGIVTITQPLIAGKRVLEERNRRSNS